MIVCGISIASSEAIMVWLDGVTRAPLDDVAAKVALADPYSKQDLSRTAEVLRQLLAERRTDLVVIRKSSTSGKYPAGHVSFRIETLIALVAQCDVTYVAPQGVAVFQKREQPAVPDSLKKYQHDAYLAAISVIS